MEKVGVLALQGDFAEHVAALTDLGAEACEVRSPRDLDDIAALIIPGGESTTISRLLQTSGLSEPIKAHVRDGLPVWGTCAGLILMAHDVEGRPVQTLDLLDVGVQRNAYGRQVDSFEADLQDAGAQGPPLKGVFIRAPKITRIGPGVQVLAHLPSGEPVAVQQDSLLGTTFHPELSGDLRFHLRLLHLAKQYLSERHATRL